MTFPWCVDHAAKRSKAAAHQDEGALRDRVERGAVVDDGESRVQHSGDQARASVDRRRCDGGALVLQDVDRRPDQCPRAAGHGVRRQWRR